MERSSPLAVKFYKSESGKQPVRDWLNTLTKEQRFHIGVDLWKVQSAWPLGMPLVRSLGEGLHEVRSSLPNGISRIIFVVRRDVMVLLHGFIKKTQKTPPEALALAMKRRRDHEQAEEI